MSAAPFWRELTKRLAPAARHAAFVRSALSAAILLAFAAQAQAEVCDADGTGGTGSATATVVLDTVDNAYRMCAEHVCKKHKIEHESDLGYGKGWALINNEFQRVLTKLAFLQEGLFLISHSQEREIETRTGRRTRIVPTLPDKARKIVVGMVDLIPRSVAATIDWDVTYANARATGIGGLRRARCPMVLDDEAACLDAAVALCGRGDRPLRIARIDSTLHLDRLLVSDALR